jgi:aspartyl-tRNA(Asn)/glutamyl-tRNA(Gln) amidotransferase subunit B
MEYEVVVGLEVHAQIATSTKLFCSCSTSFGAPPNTQVCPICLGAPGVLPVINKKAVELAIRAALGLNCKIANFTKFDRKNYFYPDLPKNYQISQYDTPLSKDGYLDIRLSGRKKRIRIKRLHLEEDAGKLIHQEEKDSLIDLNRTGIPLIEIVTEPEINSPEEAYQYLLKLKSILRYLEVSNCDMEKGELRCDINISIRRPGEELSTKTEIKNLNSFKFVARAIASEFIRQKRILQEGGKITHQTLLYDPVKDLTEIMRVKEEVHDYRYFPEPDLPPLIITQQEIQRIRDSMPEMPESKRDRFISQYRLSEYDADILTSDKALADFFEEVTTYYKNPKAICNWIINDLIGILNENDLELSHTYLKAEEFAELIRVTQEGVITNQVAKPILKELVEKGGSVQEVIRLKDLARLKDREKILEIAEGVLRENPKATSDFLSGKESALTYLIGQLMKKTQGRADPKLSREILYDLLKRNV